jgi:hypothetical protein
MEISRWSRDEETTEEALHSKTRPNLWTPCELIGEV